MNKERHTFHIANSPAPTIEVDSEAAAVYVRFRRTKIAKTISRPAKHMHLAVDLDSNGEVVGLEAVGIKEFSMQLLFKAANIDTSGFDFSKLRYIPTELVAA